MRKMSSFALLLYRIQARKDCSQTTAGRKNKTDGGSMHETVNGFMTALRIACANKRLIRKDTFARN
jgi:hypothetical protein